MIVIAGFALATAAIVLVARSVRRGGRPAAPLVGARLVDSGIGGVRARMSEPAGKGIEVSFVVRAGPARCEVRGDGNDIVSDGREPWIAPTPH